MSFTQRLFFLDVNAIDLNLIFKKRGVHEWIIDVPALDVTPIELNPHTRITGFDDNDPDISGRDRVEGVQNWSEMVTVSSEDLKKLCNTTVISMID